MLLLLFLLELHSHCCYYKVFAKQHVCYSLFDCITIPKCSMPWNVFKSFRSMLRVFHSFIHSFIHFIQTSKILVTSTNLHRQKMILINWSSITAITWSSLTSYFFYFWGSCCYNYYPWYDIVSSTQCMALGTWLSRPLRFLVVHGIFLSINISFIIGEDLTF